MMQRAYFGDFENIGAIKDYADYIVQSDVGNDYPYGFFRETIIAMASEEFWEEDEREKMKPVMNELNVLLDKNSADIYFF